MTVVEVVELAGVTGASEAAQYVSVTGRLRAEVVDQPQPPAEGTCSCPASIEVVEAFERIDACVRRLIPGNRLPSGGLMPRRGQLLLRRTLMAKHPAFGVAKHVKPLLSQLAAYFDSVDEARSRIDRAWKSTEPAQTETRKSA
jgi:hypothetical protein